MYDSLPVFADVYGLTKLIFVVTQDFPREQKYSLGQDMKRDCLSLLRTIYRANKSRDRHANSMAGGDMCIPMATRPKFR